MIIDSLPSSTDDDRWLWCGPCSAELGEPVPVEFIRRDARRLVIRCPRCGRMLRYHTQPPGGERDGLPPFLAKSRR